MMLAMASLFVALNLHESVSSTANELLLYVLNNLHLKDHPSLLHAVEISLCWIAAEELGFAIDVGRTLDVSNTVLNSNLDERKIKVIARQEIGNATGSRIEPWKWLSRNGKLNSRMNRKMPVKD